MVVLGSGAGLVVLAPLAVLRAAAGRRPLLAVPPSARTLLAPALSLPTLLLATALLSVPSLTATLPLPTAPSVSSASRRRALSLLAPSDVLGYLVRLELLVALSSLLVALLAPLDASSLWRHLS